MCSLGILNACEIINRVALLCCRHRYFTWAAAGPYLASLLLFRKPLSDATLHQLSVKDSRHLSELTDDRSQAREAPTRFGALSRWLRGSQTASHLNTMERSQHSRSPNATDSPDTVNELMHVSLNSKVDNTHYINILCANNLQNSSI